MNDFQAIEVPFVLYAFSTLVFAVLLATRRRHKSARLTSTAISCQFIFEITLECGIILQTGGAYSPYSALIVLSIVSAALWYRLSGTLLVASAASLGLALSVWTRLATAGHGWRLSYSTVGRVFENHETEFYSVLLHFFIFYLVAFIAGYLAERLNKQQVQLESASRALRQARLETDEILRQVSSGLLTIDTDGRIIYFNRAAESILGYYENDIRGLPCRDVFSERMPELAERLMEGLLYEVELPRREIVVVGRNHHQLPVGISTSLMIDAEGATKGLVAIFSDLTEAKALEEKMRSSDRLAAVGELSASIAHEIRNPLASISGSVEVLRRELQVEGENGRLMDLIVKESHRLGNILTQFLTYSRITQPVCTKVELCHVVNDSLQMLKHHSSFGHQLSLTFDTDSPAVYVLGHEDSVKQMLINLLVNGAEAIGNRPGRLVVRLDTRTQRGKADLSVIDDGPGISQSQINQIFEPFYSTKKAGTGLGLAIVHRLAESMRLNLSASSEVSIGAKFVIEFPLYKPGNSTISSPELVSRA